MPLFFLVLIGFLILAALLIGLTTLALAVRSRAALKRTLDLVMLQITLPKEDGSTDDSSENLKEKISIAEQWLSTLTQLPASRFDHLLYGAPVIVFEIVAREDGVIAFYVGTERRYIDHLEKQIYAFYPDAHVEAAQDHTLFEYGDTFKGAHLKLQRPQHLPIATYQDLEVDPLPALTGALAKLKAGDAAVIQYVCQVSSERIRRKGRRAAKRTTLGKSGGISGRNQVVQEATQLTQSQEQREKREAEAQRLTPRGQQQVELVEEKISQPQFSTSIRIGVSTRQPEETEIVLNAILGAFTQYNLPDLNFFKSIAPLQARRFVRHLIFRLPEPRLRNTLSTTELASLFHFPLPSTSTPNILWRGARLAPVPTNLAQQGIVLGHNVYRGSSVPVHLAVDDRRRHLYMIGQTGTGKTTLFLNMILQDIAAGHGVGVVDPHGDLIEDILSRLPEERADDVILFDPRDTERPLGFNILETKDPAQKDLVVNEVVEILQELAARLNPESIGPMFEHYLRNALLALAGDPQATLLDIPRMFVDQSFRAHILSQNVDPTVKQFWEQEFEQSQRGQMSADMLSYVISKLGRFISNATVRNLVGQAKSSFDVREVMDQRKILLCNLSKGQLGDINADLLGFVLVSKIQIAALGRADVPTDQRPDFYLYLDEFQNFTTESIATILSEARKYNLNLNLTHQFIQQLSDPIREAVFGNVGTIISYRIGVEDAEMLAPQFAPVFNEYDLVNLERFVAYVRLLVDGTPARPFSLSVPPPPPHTASTLREKIRELSRQRYGRDKKEVEQHIIARFNLSADQAKNSSRPGPDDYLSESLFDIS